MNKLAQCPRCELEGKLKKREFSDQAIAALVNWGELDERLVDEPVCDDCYRELREVLIDNSESLVDSNPLNRAS